MKTLTLLSILATAMASSLHANSFSEMKIISDQLPGARWITPADLDGDGDADVLAGGVDSDGLRWWENRDGVWVVHMIDRDFERPWGVVAYDMDHDRDLDVVAGSAGSEPLTWWENSDARGPGQWIRHAVPNSDYYTLAPHPIDLDGDRDVDIVSTGRDLVWWENTGPRASDWVGHTIDGAFWGVSVDFADLDGDGDLDIAGADYGAGSESTDPDVIWWERGQRYGTNWEDLPGPWDNDYRDYPTWPERTVLDIFRRATYLQFSDMDGDGDEDVVAGSEHMDDVTWIENTTGDGQNWEPHIIDDNINAVQAVVAVDLDADDDHEIVVAAAGESSVIILNRIADGGEETWGRSQLDGSMDDPVHTAVADVDGDGDLDILAADSGLGLICWWENVTPVQLPANQRWEAMRRIEISDRALELIPRSYENRERENLALGHQAVINSRPVTAVDLQTSPGLRVPANLLRMDRMIEPEIESRRRESVPTRREAPMREPTRPRR